MLICSCNIIAKAQIEDVIDGFLAQDPWLLITPSRVYQEMDKRGQCCGCFPNVVSLISARVQAFHAKIHTPDFELLPFLQQLQSVASAESPRRTVALSAASA